MRQSFFSVRFSVIQFAVLIEKLFLSYREDPYFEQQLCAKRLELFTQGMHRAN